MFRPFLVVSIFLSWVAVAFSGTPGPTVPKPPQAGSTAEARAGAIVLKPVERTGLLRSTLGLRPIRLANGPTMVDMQGRYREFVIASVDADGVLHVGCMHNEPALRMVLEGQVQAAPVRFEDR